MPIFFAHKSSPDLDVAGYALWQGIGQALPDFFSELSGDRKAVRKIASRGYTHVYMTDGGGARVRMEPD